MIKRFGLVIQTKKHYLKESEDQARYNEDSKTYIAKLVERIPGLNVEIRQLKTDRTELSKDLCAIRDLKLSERIGQLIESLQERNAAVGVANLDIVVKGPMTTYGVIEDLRKLLDDVHLTGATGRRVKKGRKSAVQ